MKQEELKQQKLDKLNRLLSEISEDKAKTIAISIKNKMGLLKACYDESKPHHKEKIHELIEYTQLRCFLTGERYSNTRGSKEIKLNHVIYSVESIKGHIKKKELPKESSWKAIDIYSFYFGSYRDFFRCFGKVFLKDEMQMDKEFLDDIFSPKKEVDSASEERLEIPGATIIDERFISNTKKEKFSIPEFYTGIKDNQWKGIINSYDVERQGYTQLKDAVVGSLNQKRQFKIPALVYGTGGSGKSTVLRRLCVDIQCLNVCEVIWIDNAVEFMQYGLSEIKKEIEVNVEQKYLVVIEDFYRMFENKTEIASEILEKLDNINNIRVVIGDRSIAGKPYEKYGVDYELLLSSNENEEIIKQIIVKFPDWKEASEKLLENQGGSQSTLFLLLFILARIHQDKTDTASVNLADPLVVFKNIIRSDIKLIEKKYVGLAKALFYWANFYSTEKIFITYETFLHIADYYEGDEKISENFRNWENGENKFLNILKLYITRNADGLVQFNHDILTDIGFSKINYPDWEEFGYEVKIQLLDVITDYGDNDSASEFLSALIKKRMNLVLGDDGKWSRFEYCILVLDDEKKLFYINKLINKKNNDSAYIHQLMSLIQDNEEQLNHYAELLWENEIYTKVFWREVLRTKSIREFWLNKICTLENFIRIDRNLIDHIVSDFNDERAVKSAVEDVLKDENWKSVHPDILWSILLDLGGNNKEELQPFADKILKIVNCARLYTDITYLSMKLASSNVREKFINTIFNTGFSKTPNLILHECLSFINDELKQKFASKFFKEVNWEECESYIAIIHMMEALESEEQQAIIKNILKKKNYQTTHSEILKYCLKTTSNTALKTEFIENVATLPLSTSTYWLYSMVLDYHYLADEKLQEKLKNIFWESIEHTFGTDLISQYLKITKDQQVALSQLKYRIDSGYRFSKDLFSNGYKEKYDNDLLSRCLMCFESNDSLPDEVELTIKKIISDFNVSCCLKSNPYYLILLKFNFHHSISWKNETKKIIENWKMYDREILYSVLGSHLYFPDEVKNLCKHIMLRWNLELGSTTRQYKTYKRYGEHLIVALGHPDLKEQAKRTAIMMLQDKESDLSEDFVKLAENIINKDQYPEWDPYDSDFADLPIYRLNPIKFIIGS